MSCDRVCSPSVSVPKMPSLVKICITFTAMIICPFTAIHISMASTACTDMDSGRHSTLSDTCTIIPNLLTPLLTVHISSNQRFWLHQAIEPCALQKDQILGDQHLTRCMIAFSRTTSHGASSPQARIRVRIPYLSRAIIYCSFAIIYLP